MDKETSSAFMRKAKEPRENYKTLAHGRCYPLGPIPNVCVYVCAFTYKCMYIHIYLYICLQLKLY